MDIDNLVDDILVKNSESPLCIGHEKTWNLINVIFKNLKHNLNTKHLLYKIYKHVINTNFKIDIVANPTHNKKFIIFDNNGKKSAYFWSAASPFQSSIIDDIIDECYKVKTHCKNIWAMHVVYYVECQSTWINSVRSIFINYVNDIPLNRESKLNSEIFRIFCAAFYESIENMAKYDDFKNLNADKYTEEVWLPNYNNTMEYLNEFSPLYGYTEKIHNGVHLGRKSVYSNEV